ncbi:diaminohydroxyphosphoribosylamino-pyrimidine deaminase [Diaporthe amygdali]|uniref:diaminohydroxyphosphoribosylamino-pyrimidine deaminase n=1 Tax=Phomopsis amygdali TaxID=1214568 RepID=UPI0022FEEF8F|nr:diaminohydroxyphosphoribosylamino-pyrimidine deaminase [Diaporthe amygdali]KAJ0115284.1 diaminohydroxyphosphoribosylamino-pyrimidine deaminase [Diaporthe amygdali]
MEGLAWPTYALGWQARQASAEWLKPSTACLAISAQKFKTRKKAKAFLLFSQSIPSQNELGIIDPKAPTLELTVNGHDLTITQSPSVLSSNRAGGTTGAVVWKVTPMFAEWLASPTNIFARAGVLSTSSTVLELGCGVSALVGLALGPLVARYVLSDQPYVARFVEQNLGQNRRAAGGGGRPVARPSGKRGRGRGRPHPGALSPSSSSSSPGAAAAAAAGGAAGSVAFHPLDWEADTPTHTLTGREDARSFDLVLGCDCVYNEALIPPFVQTCLDVCELRSAEGSLEAAPAGRPPCLCVVAQQLRDPEIFEAWLREFCARGFRAWRISDTELPEGLRSSDGFVIHVGVLQ